MNRVLQFARKRFVCGCHDGYYFDGVKYMSDIKKQMLFEHTYPVAASAFGRNDVAIKKDVYEHLASANHFSIIMNDNKGIAFRLWDFIPIDKVNDVLYLAGMCVHKDYQGKGIGKCLLELVLQSDGYRQIHSVDQICALPPCKYIVFRTQNPIMKRCFEAFVGEEIYPRFGEDVPSDIVAAASVVVNSLGDSLDSSMISRGVYGKSLYGDEVSVRSTPVSVFSAINVANGDAVYCVWRR